MVTERRFSFITVEEYLEYEKDGDVRHEYLYGEIYAMAGASAAHNIINVNIGTDLNLAARSTACRVYTNDMKVRVSDEVFYYPDIMLVCAELANDYYEVNPCVIVEVMSKTTSRKDRNEKKLAYLELESLQLYLLVDSRKRVVIAYERVETGWKEVMYPKDDVIAMPCVDANLTFEQIYAKSGR